MIVSEVDRLPFGDDLLSVQAKVVYVTTQTHQAANRTVVDSAGEIAVDMVEWTFCVGRVRTACDRKAQMLLSITAV